MTSLITEVIIELFVVPISYKIPHSSSTPSHLRRQPIFKKNILHQKQYTLDPRISRNKRVLKEISEKLPSEKNPDTITDQLQANIAVHFLEQHPYEMDTHPEDQIAQHHTHIKAEVEHVAPDQAPGRYYSSCIQPRERIQRYQQITSGSTPYPCGMQLSFLKKGVSYWHPSSYISTMYALTPFLQQV